jgi:two-component system chemotaxis sensor kinase CheA
MTIKASKAKVPRKHGTGTGNTDRDVTTFVSNQDRTFEIKMNLDPEISQEELTLFLHEAYQLIELTDEDIVLLENEKDNSELIQEIFRAIHTIKGSSAMIGHQKMTELTHAMENLLDKLRNHRLSITKDIVDTLLFSLDVLKILVNDIESLVDSNTDIEPALQKLKEITEENNRVSHHEVKHPVITNEVKKKLLASRKENLKILYITICMHNESDWPAVRCIQCLNELNHIGKVAVSCPSEEELVDGYVDSYDLEIILITAEEADKVKDLLSSITDIRTVEIKSCDASVTNDFNDDSADTEVNKGIDTTDMIVPGGNNKPLCNSPKHTVSQTIHVDVKTLDSFLKAIEELVIDCFKISRVGENLKEKYPADTLVNELLDASGRIVKTNNELHEFIAQVRMVPLSTVCGQFPRMMRDLAQTQNKKLNFVIKGADIELDRRTVERIRDPLTHILRNAVDHGIESPEIRQSLGKPETATIRLNAYRKESYVVIRIEDDGQGIDPNKVIESAVNKCQLTQAEVESLTESQAIYLIFKPGISTTEEATEVSGRGVGLDIVKTNVESMGGSTSVETILGKGSRFTIRVPFAAATVRGFPADHEARFFDPARRCSLTGLIRH